MDDITSESLLLEIERALQSISYGSIEIFVQDSTVTQITVRKIKKIKLSVNKKTNGNTHTIAVSGHGKFNGNGNLVLDKIKLNSID